MKRANIWCEVTCSSCGCMALNSGWYSPERITKLREETKDWIDYGELTGVLCPDCQREKHMNNKE